MYMSQNKKTIFHSDEVNKQLMGFSPSAAASAAFWREKDGTVRHLAADINSRFSSLLKIPMADVLPHSVPSGPSSDPSPTSRWHIDGSMSPPASKGDGVIMTPFEESRTTPLGIPAVARAGNSRDCFEGFPIDRMSVSPSEVAWARIQELEV